jgi:Arc/MetJ-type ribon-helix-helix transcriptional regulator
MARNEKKQISIRVESDVYKEIEKRVKDGDFDSNSDFVKRALDCFIHQEKLFEKLDAMQRNLMASQLDVVAEVTGMTPEEKSQSAEALNVRYQDEIFES